MTINNTNNAVINDLSQMLHNVAAFAPIIIWSNDNNGVVQFSEGQALEVLGLNSKTAVGRSLFEIYKDRQDLIHYLRRALAGEPQVVNVSLANHYFEAHYNPQFDAEGNVQGVIGIALDVTERVRTENALRESERRFAYAQKAGQTGIWEWDVKRNAIVWSDNMEAIFGFSLNKTNNATKSYITHVHPDDRKEIIREVQSSLEEWKPLHIQHRVIGSDGNIRWIYGAGNVIRDESGQPVKMLGIAQDVTERVQTEKDLKNSQTDLEMSQELAHVGSWSWDLTTNVVTGSKELYRIFGLNPETFKGNLFEYNNEVTHPDDRERVLRSIEQNRQADTEITQLEYRIIRPDGAIRNVWAYGKAVFDQNGQLYKRMGAIQDITDKVQAVSDMQKLSRALEQTDELVMITDREGRIEFVNAAFENVTGFLRNEITGKLPNILHSDIHDKKYFSELWSIILKGDSFRDVIVNKRKDGTTYCEEKTITPLLDINGNITHFVSTGRDITERIQDQKHMEFLAHHDALTRLPNRTLFSDRLNHALQRRHDNNEKLALIFVDLDRFKMINDTLGHEVGDQFLQLLSTRLLNCLRADDTIARLGGDEFAILLENIHSGEEVAGIARKILESFTKPVTVDNLDLFVTASLGISVFPMDGTDSQTLLKHADTAMYRAKDLGRNSFQFYSSDMSTKALERLTIETSLRHALEREEFVLYFQPQYDLFQQRVVGMEALLRWNHPEFGLIAPEDFIPILEEIGLILDVGAWVLHHACEHAQRWNNNGLTPIRLSVNVSTRQFGSAQFVDTVKAALQETQLDPQLLELEITESILLQNHPHIQKTFNALLDTNVRLALDDFGTGYSSLSYVKRFPIDVIKIDRSFIRDITTDADDASIVEAIIAMANSMNIEVIAEGVEIEQQQVFLLERGCHIIQGFLVGPPIEAQYMPEFSTEKLVKS